MGSVAASGGYWISTASDEIWARPGDDHRLDRHLRDVPHHRQAAREVPRRPHRRRRHDALQRRAPPRPPARPGGRRRRSSSTIDHGYEEFLARVAQARKMTPRAGGQDRPRPGLERRGREGPRPRGPARRPRPGDRVGREAGEAREGLPRVVRREGEELPREADVDARGPGARRGRRRGLGSRSLGLRRPPCRWPARLRDAAGETSSGSPAGTTPAASTPTASAATD